MTMKQTKEQFVGISYDELLAENAKLRELLQDTHNAVSEEVDRTMRDIGNYEDGSIDNLCDNFNDYARLKGFVWGMRRAIFLLKYRAKNAGIEMDE